MRPCCCWGPAARCRSSCRAAWCPAPRRRPYRRCRRRSPGAGAEMQADGCGSQINTSYVERDNLTSRQSNGRLVRKTLSHSKKVRFLECQIALEDAIYNFVRPHSALRVKLSRPRAYGRKWKPRTPAMVAGLTDHIWTLEEL